MLYLAIKHCHMTFAVLSILGFIIRGPLAINNHKIMQSRWLRVIPHINDTLLLIAAIFLAFTINAHPFNSPWITAKVIALVVYISFGTVVIKQMGSKPVLWLSYFSAIAVFVYIVAVAITKTPWL